MYRESEAQTDPYTPNYQVPEGENPEILTIAHLRWGEGLPATFDELETIEVNRERIAFEWALPPTSDEASFQLRKNLMKDQEEREWGKRDNEIKKVQNERMNLLKSALIEREKDTEERNAQRIQDVKIKKTEQKNRLIAKIQRKKIKVMRKMLKSRKEEGEPELRRDIIEEYHNFASRVYAGIAREGLSLDKISNKYEVQPLALTTYAGVGNLVQTVKPSLLETQVDVVKVMNQIDKAYTRGEKYHKVQLKKAQILIDGSPQKRREEAEQDAAKANPKIIVRPDTPHYHESDITKNEASRLQNLERYRTEEKVELAILLIQRLLRGRSKQNEMYEGKEKRLALIEELLIVANVKPLSEEEKEERLLEAHEERLKDAVLENIQGSAIARTLDMLSKELVRFKQEKRISKMVNHAENDRRTREAEERGRRQAQQILENREDVLFNEIMNMHQGTVDTYLSRMVGDAVEKASSRQAGMMAKIRKEEIDKQIEKLENKQSKPPSVIKDLLLSFLIPNIQRSKVQKQIAIEEKRFIESAKRSVKETLAQTVVRVDQPK
eukprot:CAMPEP_0176453828 /NCGR_PEP_ID=MMETSP0127-20121128/29490_1 /TAXON_ID=938130 /ORGANISM="Platyophrya macrostoma, Strain WH" /LENGTH=552 /DNA_ID=CAMNT_0017842801 /DNA_START=223 /DNA_END=1881 /DNA_ORIENTATION=+